MARIRQKTLQFPGLNNVYTFADEADLFNANVDCAVGEYRIYNGDLYCCITPHTGAWDASHFKAVKMGNEVSGLQALITKNKPVEPVSTSFFDNLNYGVPQNVEFVSGIYVNSSGKILSGANTNSLIIDIEPNTTYYFYAPSRNRGVVVESADDFIVDSTYTALSVTAEYTKINNEAIIAFTTGATAKKILIYFYSGSYDYAANKNNIILTANDFYPYIQPVLTKNVIPAIVGVEPKDTTFFSRVNYFNEKTACVFYDRYISNTGVVTKNISGSTIIVCDVEPNTTYFFYAPSMNRNYVVESATDDFKIGTTCTLLITGTSSDAFSFTTGATAKYVAIYFYNGIYDYAANKANIVLNKGEYDGIDAVPFIPYKYLPEDLSNPLNGKNILIFGDSITDCCNITVNSSDETTAYSWRNPSNSYVNGQGVTVNYSMWAKILKENQPTGEIRNYAYTGASFESQTRTSGNERQNLQYQIDIALNDRENPNNVFAVDSYVPDIVIFALGTNDNNPNDTYESAMAKTVLQSGNNSIDVEATIENLDDTKVFESARLAFLRIKQAFPMAQIFCVLPIQESTNDNFNTMHDNLKMMAERYGCVVVDGAADCGITREFNTVNAIGTYLKDGLHPNEKGQNLYARMIISSLKSHFISFGTGFNT